MSLRAQAGPPGAATQTIDLGQGYVPGSSRSELPSLILAPPPLPVAPVVTAVSSGNAVQLSWPGGAVNKFYECLDADAAGDPALRCFYVVRASNAANATIDSNRVGAISFPLQPGN